jgi:hypothetical protein
MLCNCCNTNPVQCTNHKSVYVNDKKLFDNEDMVRKDEIVRTENEI